jgi:thiaminase
VISESQRLKARGADGWAAAVAHPMVAEIGAGSLPHATFRFYFDRPATSDAFDRSTRYKLAFWQMAYTRGESDS